MEDQWVVFFKIKCLTEAKKTVSHICRSYSFALSWAQDLNDLITITSQLHLSKNLI